VKTIPLEPSFLKVMTSAPAIGVDRENKIIRGYVVALHGPFKDGRGEFDDRSLAKIVELGNSSPEGLKSRFTHPGMSDDGLGKLLGRSKNLRIDKATAIRDGKPVTVNAVRGDLHLNDASFETPHGNLGGYVMKLAETDPNALSSSLVLRVDKEKRLNGDGTAQKDDKGQDLPPLWRPTRLHASDVVDDGAAVDGFLANGDDRVAIAGLPDGEVRLGVELLDRVFEGQSREVIAARVQEYLRKYLDLRFPIDELQAQLAAKKRALRIRLAQLCGTDPGQVPAPMVEFFASGNAQLEKVG